jgi:hypothetical protein
MTVPPCARYDSSAAVAQLSFPSKSAHLDLGLLTVNYM